MKMGEKPSAALAALIRGLLQLGARANQRFQSGRTPVMCAVGCAPPGAVRGFRTAELPDHLLHAGACSCAASLQVRGVCLHAGGDRRGAAAARRGSRRQLLRRSGSAHLEAPPVHRARKELPLRQVGKAPSSALSAWSLVFWSRGGQRCTGRDLISALGTCVERWCGCSSLGEREWTSSPWRARHRSRACAWPRTITRTGWTLFRRCWRTRARLPRSPCATGLVTQRSRQL